MDDRPIGVFDSGLGGLTVLRALADLLPHEHLVYIGDSARFPYGERPLGQVALFARQLAAWLVQHADVKLIVVACNTASAAAMDQLRFEHEVPIVGMVEPGARAAARHSTGRVALLATTATIASGAYQRAFDQRPESAELFPLACPGFVELVEHGLSETPQASRQVARHLLPLREVGVDTALLGCTHYPLLAKALRHALGPEVVLVSSAEETAFEVRSLLDAGGLWRRGAAPGRRRMLTTGNPSAFAAAGRRLLGPLVGPVEHLPLVDLERRARSSY